MGVKTFNVLDISSNVALVEPAKVGYRDSIDIIKDESVKIQKSFVKIGWYLKHIRDNEFYKEDGYDNIWECAADQLGYSQSTASRFINICEKFSKNHNSPELDDKYTGFDKSQMIEMLPMSPEQMEKVTPDMTVKQIRDIKTPKIIEASEEIIADEYPDEDGTSKHDISWFVEQYVKDEPADAKRMFEVCQPDGNIADNAKAIKECIAPNGYYSKACKDYDYTFKSFSAGIIFRISDEKKFMTYKMFAKELMKLISSHQFYATSHKHDAEKYNSEDIAQYEPETSEVDSDDIPGQTSIEKDFPEYMPEGGTSVSESLEEEPEDEITIVQVLESYNMLINYCRKQKNCNKCLFAVEDDGNKLYEMQNNCILETQDTPENWQRLDLD